jgi:pilus assembly protein CpaF
MEDGHRRMVSMQEINGMEGEIITMTELFKFEREGIDEDGKVIGRYRATGIIPSFYEHLKKRGVDLHYHLFDES